MVVGRDGQVALLVSALAEPGLVVLAGGPGTGKSALARHAAPLTSRPVVETGALATLRHVPALPLSRAIRATVPVDDPALAVEAVRARIGGGILLVDDAQWADRLTLALLPELARHIRVIAAVRVPCAGPVRAALRAGATEWIDLEPLSDADAAALVAEFHPGLAADTVTRVVERAGGNPLALRVLGDDPARAANALRGVAELVAELPQTERTALAALGLLGRAAPAAALGPGGPTLAEKGVLVPAGPGELAAAEGFVAEVAAGLLPVEQRQALHRRLADLVTDDAEAARHLAAAGDRETAADRAVRAALGADSVGARAEQYAMAVACLGDAAGTDLVLDAADAASEAGLTDRVRQLTEPLEPATPTERMRRALLLGTALTEDGETERAGDLLRGVAGDLLAVDTPLRVAHAVAQVRAALASDPELALALAEYALAELGDRAPPYLSGAYGAALLVTGAEGWEEPVLAAMRHARAAGDLAERCAAGAILVAGLRESFRTERAEAVATELADECARAGSYSREVTFRVEALWARLHARGLDDDLVRAGTSLAARATPHTARPLLVATLALAHADGGALPAARAVLRDDAAVRGRLAEWVACEVAWLDGRRDAARAEAERLSADPDQAGWLARLTLAWCDADAGAVPGSPAGTEPSPVRATLDAWAGTGDFADAANGWDGVMVRERVRCLLAAAGQAGGLDALMEAERVATGNGLILLLGRVRRALRQRGVIRKPEARRVGELSPREHEALILVGRGHSTRRIAELLGLTRNTAETYIKQGMAKLGCRTRTEAAVRAAALVDVRAVDAS